MAKNELDVDVKVTVNGSDALAEFGEIKSKITGTGKEAKNSFKEVDSAVDKTSNNAKSKLGGAFDGVKGKIRGLSESFSGLNGVISGLMGAAGLSSFKSMTVDLTMARSKTKELMAATLGSKDAMNSFYGELKAGTKESVVALDMMLNSMNGIQISTGMGQENLSKLRPTIQKIGEASLLMGDDTEHATFVMREAASGLNGDFAVLKEQFGITAEKMKEAGWDGTAEDIDGYAAALEKCLEPMGDFSSISDTTTGKIEQIKKNFRTAGMDIGDQFVPYIDQAVSSFLDFQKSNDSVSQSILWIGGVTSALASLAPTLKPVLDTMDSISDGVGKLKSAKDFLFGEGDDPGKLYEIKKKVTSSYDTLKSKITSVKTMLLGDEKNPGKLFEIKQKVIQGYDTLKSKMNDVKTYLLGDEENAGKLFEIKQKVIQGYDTLKSKMNDVKTYLLGDGDSPGKLFEIKEKVLSSYDNLKTRMNDVKTYLLGDGDSPGKLFEIKENVTQSYDKLKTRILDAKNALTGNISEKIKPIQSSVLNSYSTLRTRINSVKNTLQENISNKIKAIKGGVLSSWNTLKTRINSAKTTLTQYDLKQKLVNAGSTVKGAVLNSWNTLKTRITSTSNAMSGFTLKQKLATIAQKAHTIATTLWSGVTKAATIAQTALNAVLSMNPIGIVVMAIVGLIAVLGYLYTNNEQVRNAINNLGSYLQGTFVSAWNALKSAITPVINVLKLLWTTISPLIDDIGALFGALMGGGDLGAAFNKLVTDIPLVFQRLQAIVPVLANALVNVLLSIFGRITNGVRNVFTWVVMTIRQRLTQAWTVGGMLANMVRQAIVNKFNQIIARARSIFTTIVSTIRSRLQNAVTAAKTKAQQILQGIKDKIAQIPDIVKQEFDKIKDRISNALNNAKNVAVSKINDLVAAVKGALGIASPGFIQRMMAYEFESIPTIIDDNSVRAISGATNMAKGIVSAYEENMQSLTIPDVALSNLGFNPSVPTGVVTAPIGQFDMLGPRGLSRRILEDNSNVGSSSQNNNNIDNTRNENTTIINVDKIELDCNNLTQQQSRKILYDALDGLYTGGV